MEKNSINKLKILFIIAISPVFANAAISYINTIKLNANQKSVNSANEVIIKLETTISAFKDAQIAHHGYLISNNTEYLKSYVTAREKVEENIQRLKNLTEDNQLSHQQTLLLDKKIIQTLDNFAQELYLKDNRKLTLSPNLSLNNDIQNLVISIENKEKKLLLNRSVQSNSSFKKATVTFLIAGLINLGLFTQLYYLLKSYIIKLKKTEIALRQSKNRLRTIIDAEPESIKLIHEDGTILEINASGIKMMEVDNADKLIGQSIYSSVTPEYQNAYKLMHESVCRGNQETLEFEMIGFKGTRRWMETYAIPLASEKNHSYLHLEITRDITQSKISEQKLQEQAALLDIVTNAILVKDINNRILYWNKGAEKIYGWKASEIYGKKASRLLHKEYSAQQDDALLSVINTGKWQGELHQLTREYEDIIVESSWTLLRDCRGKPKKILVENREITHNKQLEEQLLRTQRLESIGTLAGGIAHDLNNILTPILMSVQLLERKLYNSQHLQLLKTLENNAQRGANLIKNLLSFARGIEGERTLIQVKYLITEIEQIIRETFPRLIQLTVNNPSNLGYVYGDTTQLHQVLMNVVLNARDAMPLGGKLEISAEHFLIDEYYAQMNADAKIGAYTAITVADTGIGIRSDIQERIFEPFFTTKKISKGTGLGLSTALGIVKNHGGFVNIYSELNKGTIVKIYLPIQTTGEIDIADSVQLDNLNGSGELILVVDDEAAIRQITKSSLEAYNYRVLTASNGIEAVEIYAKHQTEINLVLLDMMMPDMDGETTIQMLQKINGEVKIVAISGLVLNYNAAYKPNLGIKAFVPKPCTGKELLHTINKVNRDFR